MSQLSLQTDPYQTCPETTMSYAEKYFAHVDTPALSVLPKETFLEWMTLDQLKRPRDNMVLYAILAVGSVFATGSAAAADRSDFSNVISSDTEALDGSTLHFMLVKLILASLQHLQGDYDEASELYISVYKIGQKEFLGGSSDQYHATPPSAFGLDRGRMIECAKRATWLADIMSCLSSCRSPYVQKRSMWEFQYAHHWNVPVTLDSNTMSWPDLSRIATALREVAAMAGTPLALRQHRTQVDFDATKARLDACRAIFRGERGDQAAGYEMLAVQQLDILYFFAMVLLYRRAYPPGSEPEALAHYAGQTFVYACKILDVAQQLSNSQNENAPEFTMLSPFIGLAIFEAIDVVTARGTMYDLQREASRVMSIMSTGFETLEKLSRFSRSACEQRDLAKQRMVALLRVTMIKQDGNNGGFYFSKSMQVSSSEWEQDVMYCCPLMEYFEEMNWSSLIQLDGDFFCLDADEHDDQMMNVSPGWRM